MSTPRFDLVDVTQTLRNRRKFILIVTIIAAVLGAALSFVRKKKYKAEANFIIANPLYADRTNIFRTTDMNFVDYFGGDDDIDRIVAVALSDTVRNTIADKLDLWGAYKLKKDDPEDRDKMRWVFKKNYEVERTEFTTAKVAFVDTDPERVAKVVNLSMEIMEQVFRSYYIEMKNNVSASLQRKITQLDSSIVALTDTLGNLRDQYKIYDIVNPARANLIAGQVKPTGSGFGIAMEQIQNVEAVKDQLVQDKAKSMSVLNEFQTGADMESMEYIHVITPAKPPVDPAGLGLVLTTIGAALLGFFFCSVYILLATYYKILIAVER